MYYTVLLQYFCHQFFHKAYKIVMNIINLEGGGSAEPPEPPSGYGPVYNIIILPAHVASGPLEAYNLSTPEIPYSQGLLVLVLIYSIEMVLFVWGTYNHR